jgi:uncharacterized protein YyaL (SSP411 family)
MIRLSPNPNRADLVHWLEWEEDAFRQAREHDKPVMLFLGAFWCRYCQRMDEEAFSDRENMALLSAYFVALRVEDAKRPDINARYNLNGWPTIAFLTPHGEFLAAINYLTAEEFKEVLLNVYLSYQHKRAKTGLSAQNDESRSDSAYPAAASRSPASALNEITNATMALADRVNGGYGRGQKFINAEANDFLLARYEATQDSRFLDHVCLTLDRMREGPIHDVRDGAYFRTTTGADWSQPHREKLLMEEAGLLSNCLGAFRVTGRAEYAAMAEEIIGYLDNKLFDPSTGACFGCEDFLRRETSAMESTTDEFFTIIDECVYVDANAVAMVAYLDAAAILNRADCKERALHALEFLWSHCRTAENGMYHYYDGEPRLPGLLNDQARMGLALVRAFRATHNEKYHERARELANFIIARLKNSRGGFFDSAAHELDFLKFRLTEISQNGVAALFFLKLAGSEAKYREAGLWALDAFTADLAGHGVHAAPFGRALGEWLTVGKI